MKSAMNATDSGSPKSLQDALPRARALLTDEDVVLLREKPLNEAIWSLHLTLGHSLREGLSLWSEDAVPLFQDITERMPERPALDADSASSALIAALWQEVRAGKDSL
jgi:hypothetical protein